MIRNMKPDLADMCEALAFEIRWGKNYSAYRKLVQSTRAKRDMEKLAELSVEKTKILYRIITDADWEIKKM